MTPCQSQHDVNFMRHLLQMLVVGGQFPSDQIESVDGVTPPMRRLVGMKQLQVVRSDVRRSCRVWVRQVGHDWQCGRMFQGEVIGGLQLV